MLGIANSSFCSAEQFVIKRSPALYLCFGRTPILLANLIFCFFRDTIYGGETFVMDNKTKEALKSLQAELRAVQTSLESIRQPGSAADGAEPVAPTPGPRVGARLEAKSLSDLLQPIEDDNIHVPDAAVGYAVLVRPAGGKTPKRFSPPGLPLSVLNGISEEQVAAVANALSAPPKVAILRALFSLPGGKDSAASLGETTSLSSGSLYYHLRDLSYAGLIEQAARGSYTITNKGICALLLVSALAAE
jgi:DNA-binding transcriptional ArsR family regulator